MKTKNIRRFLAHPGNISDPQLAALYAHCQDGKLSFLCCCCFIGSATADHPLKSGQDFGWLVPGAHYRVAKALPYAAEAEAEYYDLGGPRFLFWIIRPKIDHPKYPQLHEMRRRKRVLPIIHAEIMRRERMRAAFKPEFIEMVFEKRAKAKAASEVGK